MCDIRHPEPLAAGSAWSRFYRTVNTTARKIPLSITRTIPVPTVFSRNGTAFFSESTQQQRLGRSCWTMAFLNYVAYHVRMVCGISNVDGDHRRGQQVTNCHQCKQMYSSHPRISERRYNGHDAVQRRYQNDASRSGNYEKHE